MSEKDRWLLPEGIEEILPLEAQRLEAMRRRLLDLFDSWGYELVMPPLIEYLESLLTGTGRDLDLQTFKLTDQLSGRLMGVRADMTPQAARIDAHYLKRSVPVRLCYVGSVLHTRPDEFAGSRELLQLGAELFGHPGPESDIEILRLMLTALQAIGIASPHLDLGHVGVFRRLAADAGLEGALESDLFEALQRKARPDVDALLAGSTLTAERKAMLAALTDLNGGAEVLAEARTRLAAAGAAVAQALDNLQAVADAVAASHPDLPLYFDLAELRGYRYYTGVVYSVFVSGHGQAVAQGGRYDGIGKAFGRERAATGFSADLRRLLKILPGDAPVRAGIHAPWSRDGVLRKEVERLRAAGERVVIGLPGVAVSASELGCDRELVQEKGVWRIKNT
ncbi:MAG: ATP phosphoribosyltransferase regulatory subunit [Candidatus Muproteobacteria bacterium RBG_19FT_COMBO_61_10]|uniref:ATP phosphoribosyltransferase regulatory subunit n=1 Tax=Candidatus Muproteobacteria bacterium RBG_19FT_COMBO_61_10 TaxID=1817761 RepID=A0A1F6UMB9_9PROT|nr:MAG: ATP phosphoribosyltransferase regulatory subunit [Candidatus Muproteobacteria bacterium RBG_19FT_COMBO_61_10]